MANDNLEIIVSPENVDPALLRNLVHRAFAYMDSRIDPPSSLHRMSVADFAQKMKDETLIVANMNGEMVACLFCCTESDWLYVGKVAVDNQMQGRGIGRKLFDQAFKIATQHGLLGLELETRVELLGNHRTFEKLGFEKVGENAHEGYDRPTSIHMRARL